MLTAAVTNQGDGHLQAGFWETSAASQEGENLSHLFKLPNLDKYLFLDPLVT